MHGLCHSIKVGGSPIAGGVNRLENLANCRRATIGPVENPMLEAIYVCRKGGNISIPGVYLGFVDKFPLGIAFAKGLTFKMGQTHMQKYMKPCLERVLAGDIDLRFLITHRMKLDEAPSCYKTFCNKEDDMMKVVLTP